MANKTTAKDEAPKNDAPKTEKRKLAKKLASFTPFVSWHTGLVVCGEIMRRFENNTRFGDKQNLEIKLLDPCEFTSGDGEVVTLQVGDLLNVGKNAGLNTAMTLELGSTVQIECLGKKEMGKGKQPAWEFDVDYE